MPTRTRLIVGSTTTSQVTNIVRQLVILCSMLVSFLGCWNDELPVAEKAVRDQLKHSDSALFSREYLTPDGSLVCGLVNTRNSSGGYFAFKRFYSIPRLGYATIEPENKESQRAFESAWKEQGCKLTG